MKKVISLILLLISICAHAQEYSFKCTLHKEDGTIVNNCNGKIFVELDLISNNKMLLIDIESPYNKKNDSFYEMIVNGENLALCDEADIIADTDVPLIKRVIHCFSDDGRSVEIYVARPKSGGKFRYIGINQNRHNRNGEFVNEWVEIPYTGANYLGIYRVLDAAKQTIRFNRVEY